MLTFPHFYGERFKYEPIFDVILLYIEVKRKIVKFLRLFSGFIY